MLTLLADWLATTALSGTIQDVAWIIPLVQTIHILAIAIILWSAAIIDLRLMGLAVRRVPIAGMAQRFLPWIWSALTVLAISGTILIIGEPRRSLLNSAFQTKMMLLAVALILTLVFQRAVRANPEFWDHPTARRRWVWLLSALSLSLWLGVAVCGRLIAYVDQDL